MLLADRHIRDLCVADHEGRYRTDTPFKYAHGQWCHASQTWLPLSLHAAAPLIAPFSEATSGRGLISFGLTTAGYDARLAGELLVFKNTFGEPVDPKRFADEAYRDRVFDKVMAVGSQVFTLPPHGYALGRTYEYFSFPRWLKGRVVGKSTLARCFTGDTGVYLVDGSVTTFREMMRSPGERRWGVGVDISNGAYKVTELHSPRWVGREETVTITVDDGSSVSCTPDHEFLRHGGYYTPACELKPGDGIVPLYRRLYRGRQAVYIPKVGGMAPLYSLSDRWNVEHGVYEDTPGTHRHYIDGDKMNDRPTNISRKEASQHIRDHNAEYYGLGFDSTLHGSRISAGIVALMEDPEWAAMFRESQRAKSRKLWDDPVFKESLRQRSEKLRAGWNAERRSAHGEFHRQLWQDEDYQQLQRASRVRSWTPERRASHAEKMRQYHSKRRAGNHTVVSVASGKRRDVFCVTSQDTGNFALGCGLIVKNSGILINTTPAEPGWEGHLTLEISNLNNSQAVLYSMEGICQFEFELLSCDPECDYKDKRGQYDGQVGVTPARVK